MSVKATGQQYSRINSTGQYNRVSYRDDAGGEVEIQTYTQLPGMYKLKMRNAILEHEQSYLVTQEMLEMLGGAIAELITVEE